MQLASTGKTVTLDMIKFDWLPAYYENTSVSAHEDVDVLKRGS